MATAVWLGKAVNVAQRDMITVSGTWATNDTGTLTINGKDLTFTVGSSTTIPDILDIIVAMVNGASLVGTESRNTTGDKVGEFADITATDEGSTLVYLDSDVAGRPFTLTTSESTAGTGALSESTTIANQSANDWANADNWSNGAEPTGSDDVILQDSDVDIRYGLDNNAVAYNSLKIYQSYTGKLGNKKINENGSLAYDEYEEEYLKCACTDIELGIGQGTGSGRIKIDTGSTTGITVKVWNTGSSEDSDLTAVMLDGSGATKTVNVLSGDVGIAIQGGETGTVTTLNLLDGNVRHGNGTVTTLNVTGSGSYIDEGTTTTVNMKGEGTVTLNGAAATTLAVESGTVEDNTSGTTTTANVFADATLDLQGNPNSAKTYTNLVNLYPGATLNDPNGIVTFTNNFKIPGGSLDDVTLDFGQDRTYDVSS